MPDAERDRLPADRADAPRTEAVPSNEPGRRDLCQVADPSARRAQWYRERAAVHGAFVRGWLADPELLRAGTTHTVEAVAALAREAAHYARLALELENCGRPSATGK